MSAGYIYLLLAEGTQPKRYKIGLTNNPERRLAELNSRQSPYPIKMLLSIPVKNMNLSESQLHQQWANYRRHGEWFEFPDSLIQTVKDSILSHRYVEFYKPQKRTSQPSIPLKYRILVALFLAAFLWGFIRGMTMQLPTKPLQPNLSGEKHGRQSNTRSSNR